MAIEETLALPDDGNRHEAIDGAHLVSPYATGEREAPAVDPRP